MKDQFIQAIHHKKKVRLTFYSDEDEGLLFKKCAPLDCGPDQADTEGDELFYFWDLSIDAKPIRTISLKSGLISDLAVLDESFDPAEFITWDTGGTAWVVPRDWGEYS